MAMITGTVVETSKNVGTTPSLASACWRSRSIDPARGCARFGDRGADCAPLLERARRSDEHADLPIQPRRSQQPDVDVFLFVAAIGIAMPTCARLVEPARTFEAATRPDEHRDAANNPDANRSEVFLLRPSNAAAHQRPQRFARPSGAAACYPAYLRFTMTGPASANKSSNGGLADPGSAKKYDNADPWQDSTFVLDRYCGFPQGLDRNSQVPRGAP